MAREGDGQGRYVVGIIDGRWTIADHAFEPPSLIVYADEQSARRDAERFAARTQGRGIRPNA